MKLVRVLLLSSVLLAAPSLASTRSIEITDMWWTPGESGWGVNLILQNDTAYATFFLYGPTGDPVWYTAVLVYQGSSGGHQTWSGPLYQTKGPWYGGPYTAGSIRQAGTATFDLQATDQATLTYLIDGLQVTKAVHRQTWKLEDLSGSYVGGYSIRSTSCTPASLNAQKDVIAPIAISQSGNTFTARLSDASGISGVCSYTGTYTQAGKLGNVSGSYSCTDGTQGSFTLTELTSTNNGFVASMTGQNQFCQWSGNLGGIKEAP
ncbi:MAG TPA: hypothetical protein VFC24_10610 [Casimicrobiaceae bacterium]|nr:hypothetical protein [Casimicrobiaceae bacterium]